MKALKLLSLIIFYTIFSNLQALELTEREKAFVKIHPEITIGGDGNFEPWVYENYKGEIIGYDAEILKLIEKETGLKINIVLDNWPDILEKAKSREIDGLLHTSKSYEDLSFTFTIPYNYINNFVIIKYNNPTKINNLSDLENKNAAVIQNMSFYSNLTTQFKDTKLKFYKNHKKAVQSIVYEENDFFIAGESAFYIAGKIGLGEYIKPFTKLDEKLETVFAIRSDWPELKSIFNKVISSIPTEKREKMRFDWFRFSLEEVGDERLNQTLTKEEKIYLKNKKIIKYSGLPSSPPFEWNDENNQHRGVANDILKLISKKTNIKFQFVPTKSWKESLNNVKTGKVDLLFIAVETEERKEFLNFTVPYIREPLVIITKHKEFFVKNLKDIGSRKVGVVKNYAHKKGLLKKDPALNIVDVDSPIDGIDRVESGELFGFIDTLPVMAYFLKKMSINNLKIAGKFDFNLDMSIASKKDEPLLNSIMQKYLNSLSDEEKSGILDRWVAINYTDGFDYTLFIYLAIAVSIILSVLIFQIINSKKFNNKLSKLNKEVEEHLLIEQKQKALAIKQNKVFAKIISSRDLDTVLEIISESILEVIDCQFVDIFIKDNENYILSASGGRQVYENAVGTIIPKDKLFFSKTFHAKKEIIYIENIQDIDAEKYGNSVDKIKTLILVPLLSKNEIIGMLSICHDEVKPFPKENFEIVETLSKNAVIAIMNAKNYSEIESLLIKEEKQKNIAIKINELFNEMTSARDLDNIMQLIIKSLIELLDVDGVDIFIVENNSLKIIANGGLLAIPENVNLKIPKDNFFFFDEINKNKKIKYIKNLQEIEGKKFGKGIEEIKSFIMVPLVFKDEIIGIININSNNENSFSDEDIEVAKLFSRNAVIAMINAKYYEEIDKQNSSLKEANERMKLTIEGANLIPIVWNIKENIVKLGTSMRAGINSAMTIEEYLNFLHVDDKGKIKNAIDEHLSGKTEIFNEEFRVQLEGDSYSWINSILKIMEKDEKGNPVRMFGINQNINERKNVESQMVRSEKMAALGQLITSVAHEINTPIGAIKSSAENIRYSLEELPRIMPALIKLQSEEEIALFIDLIIVGIKSKITITTKEIRVKRREIKAFLDKKGIENSRKISERFAGLGIFDTSDIERFLPLALSDLNEFSFEAAYNMISSMQSTKVIEDSVQAASKIVYALRSYARVSSSEEMKTINIKDGIETVLIIYHNKIKHDIDLIREYDENISDITGFQDELNQVWTNLIHNALQAMNYDGTLRIKISENEKTQTVAISDSGAGIPENIKAKIFEPFFTTKPEGEGTGLGLGIVKKIIDKHRGKIWFESEIGNGTTFFIKLPRNYEL